MRIYSLRQQLASYLLFIGLLVFTANNSSAQMIITLNHPDNGVKDYMAYRSVNFLPGYTYTASAGNSMYAHIGLETAIGDVTYGTGFGNANFPAGIDYTLPVGKINGAASVSPSGAANYNIPIILPPGTHGLIPTLSLNYNSQSGNGFMGHGWSLGGLSQIMRSQKDIYHNGKVEPILFTTGDNYVLDGNNLIFSGTPNIYYTEAETFSRITSSGTSGGGPSYFTVETKDGLTMQYGNTPDSKLLASDLTTIVSWSLNKVTDAYGNYMEFTYIMEGSNLYISEIKYTGNTATSTLPYCRIKFVYDTREDINLTYLGRFDGIGPLEVGNNLLLTGINIYAENIPVKSYVIEYTQQLYSLVSEVKEFGADGTQLNSTKFKYGDDTQTLSSSTPAILPVTGIDYRTGDFNGDGYADLTGFTYVIAGGNKNYQNWKLFINDKQGSFTEVVSNGVLPANFFPVDPANPIAATGLRNMGMDIFDLNGDGLEDLLLAGLTAGTYSYTPYYSTGNNFTAGTNVFTINFAHKFTMGDFDGDGIIDAFAYDLVNNMWKVYFFNTGLGKTSSTITSLSPGGCCNGIVQPNANFFIPLDWDGDGTTELLTTELDDAASIILDITGTGTNTFVKEVYHNTNYPGLSLSEFHVGDFNGDVKTDILQHNVSNGNSYLTINRGYYNDVDPITLPASGGIYNRTRYVRDINGDGKSDIVSATLNTSANTFDEIQVRYSQGVDFIQHIFPVNIPFDNGILFEFADFNGDGTEEMFFKDMSQIKIFELTTDPTASLIQAVEDGHSFVTNFTYLPLSSSDVYTKGSGSVYPVVDVQRPMYVVSEISFPADDVNQTDNLTTYTYEAARIHRTGKGFLGFEKMTAENNVGLTTSISEWEIDPTFFVPMPKRTDVYITSNMGHVSEIINVNSVTSITSPPGYVSRYKYELLSTLAFDHVTGANTSSGSTYDSYGNVLTSTVNKNGLETIVTTNTINPTPMGAWIPTRVSNVEITKTRFGMPAYTREVDFTYYPNGGLQLQTSDPGQTKSTNTTYFYDLFGNLINTVMSATGLTSRYKNYQWDTKGRFNIEEENSLGQTAETVYDTRFGTPTSVTGIDNLTTTYTYDGFGILTSTTDPKNVTVNYSTEWKLYGEIIVPGTPISLGVYKNIVEHPGKPDVTTWKDLYDRTCATKIEGFTDDIYTLTAYDARGNVMQSTASFYADDINDTELDIFQYDDYNRILSKQNSAGTTSYNYTDGGGNRTIEITDAAGQIASQVIDATGRVISITDGGGTMEYTYASNGKPTKVELDGTDISTMTYDQYGNQISHTEVNAGTITYDYNAFGELIAQTDANAKDYTMQYDVLGRITTKTLEGVATTYSYITSGNGINELQSVTVNGGATEFYVYDTYSRVTSATQTLIPNSFTTQYTYDNYDNVTSTTYPSGFVTITNYDANGYVDNITNSGGSITIFQNDEMSALGQYTKYTMGNGIQTQRTYDGFGFPTKFKAGTVQELNFVFDQENGNLLSRNDAIKSLTETFQFDNLNRLTESQVTGQPSMEINYANNGNITFKTDAGDYTYHTTKLNAVELIENNTGTIAEDDQDITYNNINRASVIEEGDYDLYIDYNANDFRIKAEMFYENVLSYTRYYSTNYEKQVSTGNTKEVHYIPCANGIDAVYVIENGIGTYYYLYGDHLGSILTVTNAAGAVVAEQSFDAWGRKRNPNNWTYASIPTTPAWLWRGFTGHEHYPEFDLINMNARLYDPTIGRMLGPDNFVADGTQGLCRYAYANNNPVTYVDPDGNFVSAPIIIGAIFGALAGYQIAHSKGYGLRDGETWAYMAAGAGIGALAGSVSSSITAGGGFMSNTAGMAASSFVNGVGMTILSGGASQGNINFGFASYSMSTGRFQSIFNWKRLSAGEKWGYIFGTLANVRDIVAGTHGTSIDVLARREVAGHSQNRPTKYNGKDILISVEPGDGGRATPDKNYLNDAHEDLVWEWQYAKKAACGNNRHLINDNKIFERTVTNINGNALVRMTQNLNSGRNLLNTGDLMYGIGRGCVNYMSRALLYSGVINVNAFLGLISLSAPATLNGELWIQQMGIYSSHYLLER